MVHIIVDSASDSRKNAELYYATVPVTVTIDETEYTDGVNLDADGFYKLLTTAKDFPKTAQPSPQQFLEIFEKAKEHGDEVICFAISSALSGTYQSAIIAKEMAEYEGIHIFDSKTASHGINYMAGYAAHLAKNGHPASEILGICEKLSDRIKIFAGVDTLEYLYRGGRLSKTSFAVGELAKVKPVITITDEGTVAVAGKSLGKVGAMQQIIKQLALCPPDNHFPMYSLYTYGTDNCLQMEQLLAAKGYTVKDRLQVGASIGAHVGPGVYGILYISQ